MKAREETVTTPPPEESKHIVNVPPFHHREDSPTDYPPKDQPEAPLGAEDGSVIPPVDRTQCVPQVRQLIHQLKVKEDQGG